MLAFAYSLYVLLLCCCVSAEEYNALYVAEPEFVSELVGLVQAEEAVPEEALRTLALRALAAQLHDRSRISSVIAAVTSGGQSGLLSMLLHKSIASILQQADVPLAPSGSGVLPADVAAAAAAATGAGAPTSSFAASSSSGGAMGAAAAAAPPVGSVQYSVAFVDALLSVVAALVQSSSGYQALNDAGVVAALLPLMRDLHSDHLGLVCTNLRILEAYMDLSQSAATMFRDLGGLTEMIKRLAHEVGVLTPPGQQRGGEGSAEGAVRTVADSDVLMASAEQPQVQQQAQAAAGADAAAAPTPVKQVPLCGWWCAVYSVAVQAADFRAVR
jgi:E3 ubiquitin-protein ligase HUWE1